MFYDRQLERQGDSMQISILLMEQIFELFLMILMGFIIVKAGIVKEEDSKVLSKIVLYLIIPCVIINAFQVDYTKKTVNGLLIALAASVLLQVVLLLVVFVMGKLFSLNEVETASIYYSNSGKKHSGYNHAGWPDHISNTGDGICNEFRQPDSGEK